ncbi:MAG TPA: hypothetical protein VMM12_18475 [Longimicrobiales bacterium]|nr:hypothetical protein [Longimicrobiales bacterium]
MLSAQQPALLGARLRVEIEEDPERRTALVVLEYQLRVDATMTDLPILGLPFGGAVPEGLRVHVDGVAAEAELRATAPGRLEGSIRLPPRREELISLSLAYRVAQPSTPGAYRGTVPLLLPPAVPVGAPANFFVATLRLPPGHSVLEAFPALQGGAVDVAGTTGRLRLQVVPGVVRWHARIGKPPLLRFGRIIDLLALMVLAATGTIAGVVLSRQSRS